MSAKFMQVALVRFHVAMETDNYHQIPVILEKLKKLVVLRMFFSGFTFWIEP